MTNLPNQIAIYSHDQKGFKALHTFEGWRVALSNAPEKETVSTLSRHMLTDECFILLSGRGLLISAGNGDTPGALICYQMEPLFVYNVPKEVWHAHLMDAGSTLAIVENADTGAHNSQEQPLSSTAMAHLKSL